MPQFDITPSLPAPVYRGQTLSGYILTGSELTPAGAYSLYLLSNSLGYQLVASGTADDSGIVTFSAPVIPLDAAIDHIVNWSITDFTDEAISDTFAVISKIIVSPPGDHSTADTVSLIITGLTPDSAIISAALEPGDIEITAIEGQQADGSGNLTVGLSFAGFPAGTYSIVVFDENSVEADSDTFGLTEADAEADAGTTGTADLSFPVPAILGNNVPAIAPTVETVLHRPRKQFISGSGSVLFRAPEIRGRGRVQQVVSGVGAVHSRIGASGSGLLIIHGVGSIEAKATYKARGVQVFTAAADTRFSRSVVVGFGTVSYPEKERLALMRQQEDILLLGIF